MNVRPGGSATVQELSVAALRTPIGALVARPWFDWLALKVLAGWFFPLSRLWAAAGVAEGSAEKYLAELSVAPSGSLTRRLESRLAAFERANAAAIDSEAAWEHAFFGSGSMPGNQLAAIESVRLARKNDFNLQRRNFMQLGLAGRVAPIRWDVPDPAAVEAIYGKLADTPTDAFCVPDPMPAIAESKSVTVGGSRDHWLRFRSPSARLGDEVVARVHAPEGVENPPTLIFGHGICVEFDHWRGLVDEVADLVSLGVRVVRPEAPWHGRRRPRGQYAGERFMATAPLGALDLFTSAAREWAVLMDWCRRTTNGPVCIGGSSLGAMTAQLLATRAHAWPRHLQPDAMLLITHCGHIHDAVVDGALAKVWGIEDATIARGWTSERVERFLPLLDPTGLPAVDPANIVTILGSRDDVTPFKSARELIADWRIPGENVFVSRNGHFSVPLAMLRNKAPLHRFRSILDRLG